MTEDPSPESAAQGPGREREALLGCDRAELTERLRPFLDRPYRVEQIYKALYVQGVSDLNEITVLGKRLRNELAERFEVGALEVVDRRESADGTAKYLFRLADGATIETVDIPDRGRRTLCLSSQAGCALACRFCVTGYWGAGRDLTAGEILGQIIAVTGGLEAQQSLNVVFMGMGEPLLNLDAVHRTLEVATEWISWRRATVSTVGIVPGIEAMATWEKRPNLAVSLHAPDDARRDQIMPINRRYPLARLFEELSRFPLEPSRKLTFEYVLIDGFNDRQEDADLLASRLRPLRSKVNLIPINPDPVLGEAMVPPPDSVVDAFRQRLIAHGVFTSVRRRRGDEVSAACGQLRSFGRDPRGFRRSDLSL